MKKIRPANEADNRVTIYTDGSCIRNPGGPGGWAFIVIRKNFSNRIIREFLSSGGECASTNNRMEMMAAIKAIEICNSVYKKFEIHTDSMYLINCATGIWSRKTNVDLWSLWDSVSDNVQIDWVWVKGHNGDYYNELVDNRAYKRAKERITNRKKI